jgi:D-alanyl-D-alanine carboxypeptidase
MLTGLAVIVGMVALAALPFVLFTPRAPKVPPGVATIETLDTYFRALTAGETPPALQILVLKDGKTAYQKSFGVVDPDSRRPASADDVYHFWSVTKLFTATAIMQLAEDGRLTLEDPVTRYVPEFQAVRGAGNPVTITVRQLLAHTSGMKNLGPADLLGWIHHLDDPPVSQSALVARRMAKYRFLAREPGQSGAYSNAGYIVLSAVIESVTGRPYEDFIRERILGPLAMQSTDFIYRNDLRPRAVAGTHPLFHFFTPLLVLIHHDWLSRWVSRIANRRMWLSPLYTDYTGPTGLIGSAADLARFGQSFLSGGELGGRRLLAAESVRLLLDEGYGTSPGPDRNRMGLGWHWWSEAPLPFKGHAGEGPGFAAQLAIFPAQNMVIVILANDTLIDRIGLTNVVASAFGY